MCLGAIATVLLVKAGVTTPENLSAKRPYIIVAAFVVGMFLTPPDVFSQTMLAVPVWILFEIGLYFSKITQRKKLEKEKKEEAEFDPTG